MKKVSVIFLSVIIFSFSCIDAAKVSYSKESDEIVLRVLEDNIYFYSSQEFLISDRYFKLTRTYFLIGESSGDGYYVRYKSGTPLELRGFVKKTDVEVYKEQTPSLIYPDIFAISQGILSFYSKPGDPVPKFSERVNNLECYGKLTFNNKEYVLVYYPGNGLFYVNLNDVNYMEPAVHPVPIKSAGVEENNNGGNDEKNNPDNNTNINEIIQIVIIAAIVVFALLIVYLMFKPGSLKYQKPKD